MVGAGVGLGVMVGLSSELGAGEGVSAGSVAPRGRAGAGGAGHELKRSTRPRHSASTLTTGAQRFTGILGAQQMPAERLTYQSRREQASEAPRARGLAAA